MMPASASAFAISALASSLEAKNATCGRSAMMRCVVATATGSDAPRNVTALSRSRDAYAKQRLDRNVPFLEHAQDRLTDDARCTNNRDPHELASVNSNDSSPIVKPDCLRTLRTASTIPGPNESRESESWRIVSVSPSPPKSTSWCATSPGRRTL